MKDSLLFVVSMSCEGAVDVNCVMSHAPMAFEGSPCHSVCRGKLLRKSTNEYDAFCCSEGFPD